jgi:hypothetical protein
MEVVVKLRLTPAEAIDITTADIESELIHRLVRDVENVESAVILRPRKIGPSRLWDSGTGYIADETTRQEL